MITELHLENWKSFSTSVLHVDPLTVLIGLNASGKSNALDALMFLKRVASGIPIFTALQGDQNLAGVRGGIEWAAFNKTGRFALSVIVKADEERTEYHYRIECNVGIASCDLTSESLQRLKYRKVRSDRKHNDGTSQPYTINLYRTEPCENNDPSIIAKLYNEKAGTRRPSLRTHAIISQLVQQTLRSEIEDGVRTVTTALKNIFILDPIPAHMRSYSPLSDQLAQDGANIAGVIAAVPEGERLELERTLTDYAGHLPERDILRIYTEPVGKFGNDAMLYCDEKWGESSQPMSVDARGMSDGTLRFLSILTALMTRPKHSLLVVEEIDNGLHPSRAGLLLKILREIGQKRKIDVVVTTHNPAFLDAAGPSLVPFIIIAHREQKTGASQLTLLEDIRQLPKLLAAAPVGTLSAQGKLEQALERRV